MEANFPFGAPQYEAQAQTYHRFMLGLKWLLIHMGTLMVFLTLCFATPAGFWAGLFGGAAVYASGAFAMRYWLAHSTEREPEEVARRLP